jgi:hypothetical protein
LDAPPLITTLPAAPAKPRVAYIAESSEKPGTSLAMSSAVCGAEGAKKAAS